MRVLVMMRCPTRDDRGAVAIIVALTTVVMVGALAFVTDFGMAYSNKRSMQNGVDAAALAAAQQIALDAPNGIPCLVLAPLYGSSARDVAVDYFRRNMPDTSATVGPGTAGVDVRCEPNVGLTVTVTASQASPAFFGGIFGTSSVPVGATAKAVVGPPRTVTGLRPFAICEASAIAAAATPTVNYTFSFDNANLGCGYAPGNWGVLDFDGGSNPTGEVAGWILNGYAGPISAAPPVIIGGNPGAPNPGALDTEMNTVLDEEVMLPVFDLVTGTGSNSQFRIVGFVPVTICGWKFNNASGQGACFQSAVVPIPAPTDYLQIKYGRFLAIGEIDTHCPIGGSTTDPTCDLTGTRVVMLAN